MTDEQIADERPTDQRTASEPDADRAAARVIRNYSIAAAAAAVQPIPLVVFALLTPIQVGMVRSVAMVYGQPLGLRSALDLLGTFADLAPGRAG
jgi:uncharacterized protein (DUF697 family)